MAGLEVLCLAAEEIESLVTREEVLAVTEEAYRRVAHGKIVSPVKVSLPLPGNDERNMHWINSMPALLVDENVVGVKWVNVTSANRTRSLPVTVGTIILNDATTGVPLAILDGTWITHVRTGASVGIGVKYFARRDAARATIIGAGSEGRSAFDALTSVCRPAKVTVVDINPSAARKFVEEKSRPGIEFVVSGDAETAVRDSDIVILTTTARKPILKVESAKPGDFVCTVSCMSDLDSRFIDRSDKFVVDDAHCALQRISAMAGLTVGPEKLHADICQVAAGERPGRENDREIITYAPAGMGAVDISVANLAYRKARQAKMGARLPLIKNFESVLK